MYRSAKPQYMVYTAAETGKSKEMNGEKAQMITMMMTMIVVTVLLLMVFTQCEVDRCWDWYVDGVGETIQWRLERHQWNYQEQNCVRYCSVY